MLEMYRHQISGQLEATLCTLNACVDRCPDGAWNAPVKELAFCQAVFHTLFFTDLYLDHSIDAFRAQPFHREHGPAFFGNYEELEPRKPAVLYDKDAIRTYLAYCRSKVADVIAAETAETMQEPADGFEWLPALTRAGLYVYLIRHIQHHAAQLSLRLRLDTGDGAPWIKHGWG